MVTHNTVTMNAAYFTEFPEVFFGTQWGLSFMRHNWKTDGTIANRNQLVRDWDLEKAVPLSDAASKRIGVTPSHIERGTLPIEWQDDIEAYKLKDETMGYLVLSSPHSHKINENFVPQGWQIVKPVTNKHCTSVVRIMTKYQWTTDPL